MPEESFIDLGASPEVTRALFERGAKAPFPIQTMVIPDALAGHDVLGRSKTGSGKTLAFAVPIVERLDPAGPRPAALILTPTRELAAQVAGEFEAIAGTKGLTTGAAYGGIPISEQTRATKAHVLIATPGRLDDLVRRRLISLGAVSTLVLDEADRLLDMGFLPQVDRIVRRIPAERQTMFFSATLDGAVGAMARAYTRDPRRHEIVDQHMTVDEADHRFIPVEAGGKVEALAKLLSEKDRGLTLVFVRTKRGADRLAQKLKTRGFKVLALHGDMTQAAREHALARFEAGRVDTLVATDVAARGLDLQRVTLVVNFDPPEDDKAYVHRVGRTARAGRSGTGVTFVQPGEQADLSRMADRLKLADEFQEEGMKIAPPRLVFSSGRGRRSGLGRRRARR